MLIIPCWPLGKQYVLGSSDLFDQKTFLPRRHRGAICSSENTHGPSNLLYHLGLIIVQYLVGLNQNLCFHSLVRRPWDWFWFVSVTRINSGGLVTAAIITLRGEIISKSLGACQTWNTAPSCLPRRFYPAPISWKSKVHMLNVYSSGWCCWKVGDLWAGTLWEVFMSLGSWREFVGSRWLPLPPFFYGPSWSEREALLLLSFTSLLQADAKGR